MVSVVSFPLDSREDAALEATARAQGESPATFARKATLERIKRIERRKPLRDKMEELG